MNYEQCMNSKVKIKDTKQKIAFTKFEGRSCARKSSVAFLTFHMFPCKLAGKKLETNVWKFKTRLNVF